MGGSKDYNKDCNHNSGMANNHRTSRDKDRTRKTLPNAHKGGYGQCSFE